MSRKYTKINQYEKQILSMKKEGKTQREIAERLGLEKNQIKVPSLPAQAVKNRSRSQDSPTRQTTQRF